MGPLDESTPSVRVELSTDANLAAPAVPEPAGAGSSKRSIAVVAAGLLLVALVVALVAPEDGTTAAGTPITTPTTSTSTSTSTVAPGAAVEQDSQEALADQTTEEPDADRPDRRIDERFENAELGFFPFNIIEADVGWWALGFDNQNGRGTVYRSLDGLDWTTFKLGSLPDGDLVGFELLSDGFVAVVDEMSAWSGDNFVQPQEATHRLSFWESTDALTWTASTDRPIVEGLGFPYPVSLSDDASAVTVIEPGDADPDGPLIRYLAPVMNAADAMRTCSASSLFSDGVREYEFLDCDDEVIVSALGTDIPEIATRQFDPTLCVEVLRQQMQQRNVTRIVGTDGSTTELDLGLRYGLFGKLFGDTFISLASVPESSPALACFPDDGLQASDELGGALLWRHDLGPTPIDVQGVGRGDGLGTLVETTDGRILIPSLGGVFMSTYPYLDWEEVAATAADDRPTIGAISVSADGALLMGYWAPNWYFARPDDTTWFEVEGDDQPSLLVATDEYAIVMSDGRGVTRLYKVPLNGLDR